MNRSYELLYVLKPDLGEEGLAALDDRIQGLIEANGEISNIDVWGNRRLAYEIEDYTEGYYVVLQFNSEPTFPVELERQLRINDSVLRYLITSAQ